MSIDPVQQLTDTYSASTATEQSPGSTPSRQATELPARPPLHCDSAPPHSFDRHTRLPIQALIAQKVSRGVKSGELPLLQRYPREVVDRATFVAAKGVAALMVE